ncbi:hypothetical protein LA080_000975 [Diaporthe eres]|nr:hypothetical protein LA080_000975 [Diaporthe eres]
MGSAADLTFVSITGTTLDKVNAKAMRAHTTRANFARRRRRLERDYAEQKESAARFGSLRVGEDGPNTGRGLVVDIQHPIFSHPGLGYRLNRKDAFFIHHLTKAMEKLHLVTDIPESDTAFAVIQSDWARFLPDPTMLDVSLYFARHVYAARRQHRSVQLILDTYKGRAIQSVRERLNHGPDGVTDSVVAAVLILAVLDQGLGNVEAWKIHISGLLQTLASHAMQGLLLLARHDVTVLNTVEKTGMFDTMFSAPAKKAAYLILENAEQVNAMLQTYAPNKQFRCGERSRLNRVIESLDTAIQLDRTSYPREAFLTAIALSIKVFLEIMLQCTKDTEDGPANTAIQLMEVFQRPEQQLPSSLALCSSLESQFWQTMMGIIAAPDDRTKSFFTLRLNRIIVALALTSWHDASVILQRYFWVPSIFSGPGYHIFSEVLHAQGYTDV